MKANTVWISDVHMGTNLCQYEKLSAFLKSFESEDRMTYTVKKLYLNGDILDLVNFNSKLFWSEHRVILKQILRMADHGVHVIYILGNHETPLRKELKHDAYNIDLNGIEIKQQDIHLGVDGKRYLVTHGDEFDGIVNLHPFLYRLGDIGYELLINLNRVQNFFRRLIGLKQWSFSLWIKSHVKDAIKFINNFETLLVREAKKHNCDAVCNGHIHKLDDKLINGVRYLNSGCWTEFTSYIIEYEDGRIEACMYD